MARAIRQIAWAPQAGPQHALLHCPAPEILFGGARGGGKTDGILGKWWHKSQRYRTAFNAVFFRREMPQSDDVIERAREIYEPQGARYHVQKTEFRMPGAGRIRFRPLERVADAEKYQGQNLTDVAIEEAGNYPDPTPVDRISGAMRSPRGVPIQKILTANPGGAGHQWLKQRYIDPHPMGMEIFDRPLPRGQSIRAIYIPSRVQQNRILLERDPDYVNRLYAVGSEQMVKAWLEGDWSAIDGAYFDCWSSERHIVPPFTIPEHWPRFMAFDWGSARPFSCGWYAISDGTVPGVPKGALVRYREWYGCEQGQYNTGLKMRAAEVAAGILQREGGDAQRMLYRVADPAVFIESGGPSIGEMMHNEGVTFRPADNKRLPGWQQVRSRLIGDDDGPQLVVTGNCTHAIRTLPALQHDERHPEDLDTDAEDHVADEIRYACMSRPYTPAGEPKQRPKADPGRLLVSDLMDEADAYRDDMERI